MNKTRLKSGLLALVTSAALMAPAVYACEHGDGFHGKAKHGEQRGAPGHMRHMFRDLELTEKQQADIKALMEQHREARKDQRPSKEDRQARKAQMLEYVTADKFDEAKAKQAMQQRQAKREQGALEMIKVHREIYKLLTPEQQAKFKENFGKREKRGERKGDRP
ncbi:Spy/CpxP family protein refolding chaperone [Shewanella sp. Isolate11]|uniref:Spy/CpxP family protein refolding chaperone n=1 Tax=Shewanella sp. Isolate11 TaxID=2908530 RepID=UPI001EFC7858|nr:Spy/CpxP family protein refolding chaperone [Shewanella sp. Isolate11]MCG9697873.1 Spy/CpxP family protein refolding chaperone [Shewanella sp. Isolate11]